MPKELDPYAHALSNGLIAGTDHPVGTLISDVQERLPIHCHGVDFGLVDGFSKTWTFFPLDNLQKLSRLADVPSMPRSLAENMAFYTRHGLDSRVSMIGIDYPSRTVNVYFLGAPAECRDPEAVRSMLREFGLPDPSEQMLDLARQATGFYTTLTYDSPKIQRITFAVIIPDLLVVHTPKPSALTVLLKLPNACAPAAPGRITAWSSPSRTDARLTRNLIGVPGESFFVQQMCGSFASTTHAIPQPQHCSSSAWMSASLLNYLGMQTPEQRERSISTCCQP